MIGVACGPYVPTEWLGIPKKPAGTTYAVERWRDIRGEMIPMLVRHWREVALNHDDVPLDIDEQKYSDLDEAGALHIVTARRGGVLIGYHVAIVSTHLHYRSTLHGITDVYFVLPEYRAGRTGLRLFQAVERELGQVKRERGHRHMKLFTATKLHLDQGRLFEHLGYTAVERLYAKLI
jgi:GNAT superfamily N-acetyltransferase